MDIVGIYTENFNKELNINLPIGNIYKSNGLTVHIKKRHPGLEKYMPDIPSIIAEPDYIGTNPKEPNSVEFIKVFSDNIQVAIKLDTNKKYLYVASLYDISNAKLHNRLKSGRIKKYKI